MVAFYNKADQELYKNYQYLPQEQYRLGLNLPKDTQAETVNTTFGIPATNAFANSDNTIFSPSGNAFGYGSPVSEVNVRTFNPQPYGTGIESAQQAYNQATQALAAGVNPNAQGFASFTGGTLEGLRDTANEMIMDNKEQYGAQGQYISPYDDTVDQSKYTTTIGSFPSRAFFNRLRNKGFNIAENIPYIGTAARILKGFLPQQEDRGPGGGTYGIAGLSDAQKTQYNALAKEGFLFDGPSGIKTLTGKNFAAKNYLEGQLELAQKFGFDTMTDEEIDKAIAKMKANPKKQFQYKQMLESSAMYKTNKAAEEKRKQEFEKPGGTQEQVANLQKEIDTGKYSGGSDFAQKNQAAVGGGEKGRAANTDDDKSTGTSQGYSQHYIKGGLVSFL